MKEYALYFGIQEQGELQRRCKLGEVQNEFPMPEGNSNVSEGNQSFSIKMSDDFKTDPLSGNLLFVFLFVNVFCYHIFFN